MAQDNSSSSSAVPDLLAWLRVESNLLRGFRQTFDAAPVSEADPCSGKMILAHEDSGRKGSSRFE